jgi:hypothetical protein
MWTSVMAKGLAGRAGGVHAPSMCRQKQTARLFRPGGLSSNCV